MAESEIPADIRATAKAVRDKLCIDCECTFDRGCGCLDALHEALLAERQRAARIAETWKSPLRPGTEMRLMGHREAARDIADAIRQDNPNET